jgi:chromosome segregation ATPase
MSNIPNEPLKNENSNDTLTNKWLEVKVLNAELASADAKLRKTDLALKRAEGKLKTLQDDIRAIGEQKAKSVADLTTVKHRLDEVVKEYHAKIDALKFELRGVENEIKDRSSYRDEQERQINDAAERGNEELKIIKYQLEDLARVKQDVEHQIYDSRELLKTTENSLNDLHTQYHDLQVALLKKHDDLIEATKVAAGELSQVLATHDEIVAKTTKKLQLLKEKEESIMARESAIQKRSTELDVRERRLDSAERLYS